MNKRYQVFISSTYLDLQLERQELIRALLELDCIPAGMELFPAADDDAWTLIKRVIDESDYYLVVSAGRYGSVHPDTGVSYTEMEYNYAVSQGIPIIGFLHEDTGKITAEKSEEQKELKEKLNNFKDKISKKVTKSYNSPDMLAAVATRAIVQMIRQKPAVGWIRANQAADPETASAIVDLKLQLSEKDKQIQQLKSIRPIEEPNVQKNLGVPLTSTYLQRLELQDHTPNIVQTVLSTLSELRTASKFAPFDRVATIVSEKANIDKEIAANVLFALSEDKYFEIDGDDDIVISTEFLKRFRMSMISANIEA